MIMGSPYENQEDWFIVATKFENTIYLYQVEDDNRDTKIWEHQLKKYLLSGNTYTNFKKKTLLTLSLII